MSGCRLLLLPERPHGFHSNVSIEGNSAWDAVRASRIVAPQHRQATQFPFNELGEHGALAKTKFSLGFGRVRVQPLL